MADKTETIHVKVLTYNPAQGEMIPVPGAELLCEHSGFLYDPNLSSGTPTTDNAGVATVEITFDEAEENSLNPYFTITIPSASRTLPVAGPVDEQITLPDEWTTRHYHNRRIPRITDHTDPNNPLEIFVGLHANLKFAYPDFHDSNKRNPLAIPQDTVQVYLADYDAFIFDWLNPDDTLGGFGYNPHPAPGESKNIAVGEEDRYPYYDVWPTVPCALDDPPGQPKAHIDPPYAPVARLGGGSFSQTGPLAVDHHGFVFMIDGNVIHRFYPDGAYIETIADPGSGVTLSNPKGIALGQYRNLLIADTDNHRIVIFRPDWKDGQPSLVTGRYKFYKTVGIPGPGAASSQFDRPQGLTVVHERKVDGEEWLAVADTGNHRVQLFSITRRTTGGDSDYHANRVVFPFSFDLNHFTEFGAPASGSGAAAGSPVPATLWEPVDVTSDREKRLYVCDSVWHRVSRWDLNPAGNAYLHQADWEKSGGGSGSGNGEFDLPVALATDLTNNYIYVADFNNQRIQRLDNTGNHLVNWDMGLASPPTPAGVAVDPRGQVYGADGANQRVVRGTVFEGSGALKPGSQAPDGVGDPWTPISEPDHMSEPAYTYFDGDGKLWISDTGNNRVLIYTRNGAGELVPDATPSVTGLNRPVGIVKYETGEVFIADSNGHQVRKYDAALAHLADIGTGTPGNGDDQFNHPMGLGVAKQAEPVLYIADQLNNRVKMHKLNGDYIGSITGDGTLNLDRPEDVAIDPDGHLYIADTDNARVLQFSLTMDGPVATAPVFVRSITPTGMNFIKPSGVSLDEENKLIVTDRDQGTVFRLESDGDVFAFWDMNGFIRQDVDSGTDYYPELARLLRFDQPCRGVMDSEGLLAVADTGHHQVRLIRTQTQLKLNLFDIGQGVFEKLPDISFRVKGEADWSQSLGLEVDLDTELSTEPDEDVAQDQWNYHGLLTSEDFSSVVVNVLKVMRLYQKWFKAHSRAAEEERRWGRTDEPHSVNIDIEEDRSFYFLDVNLSRDEDGSPHGRGADGWDDAVVAHELSHWLFEKNTGPYPVQDLNFFRWIRISASHSRVLIDTYDLALSEGWAEYVMHFWGNHYGSNDRVRGYGFWGKSLGNIREKDRPYERLFGGGANPPPNFDEPEKGLRSEGYISNTLYQIHRAIADSDVMFADSPAYWHGYNFNVSNDMATRFSNTIWKALERFQENLPSADRGSRVFLTKLIDEFHTSEPQYAQIAQSIFELNNMLMPVLSIHEETSPGNLGDALDDEFDLPVTVQKILVVKVETASGHPLEAYNLKIEILSGTTSHYSLDPPGAGPARRHGRMTPASPPSNELYRATDGDGHVKLKCLAASGAGASALIKATCQPDFDNDETFAPPQAGDDYPATLRKLYLYELRAAAKVWSGTDNNFGAMVSKELEINIV
jgi:DNA-binding beta-propeller fold protein YncE